MVQVQYLICIKKLQKRRAKSFYHPFLVALSFLLTVTFLEKSTVYNSRVDCVSLYSKSEVMLIEQCF